MDVELRPIFRNLCRAIAILQTPTESPAWPPVMACGEAAWSRHRRKIGIHREASLSYGIRIQIQIPSCLKRTLGSAILPLEAVLPAWRQAFHGPGNTHTRLCAHKKWSYMPCIHPIIIWVATKSGVHWHVALNLLSISRNLSTDLNPGRSIAYHFIMILMLSSCW